MRTIERINMIDPPVADHMNENEMSRNLPGKLRSGGSRGGVPLTVALLYSSLNGIPR